MLLIPTMAKSLTVSCQRGSLIHLPPAVQCLQLPCMSRRRPRARARC